MFSIAAVRPASSPPQTSDGVQRLTSECEQGKYKSCSDLGHMYAQDRGVTKDEARAIAFYQRACDGGVAHDCNILGVIYGHGRGVPQDEARAAALHQRACDGGDATGCGNLGFMYVSGSGVAKDEARAAALFQRGCEGGDAMGCVSLGHMYWNAHGVAKDEARAAALYQRGCDGGAAVGCSSLARLLLLSTTEQPSLRDTKAALVLARKAVQITNSEDAYYLDTLAYVLYANGLYADALETERKALSLEPDNQQWKDRVLFFSKAVK
jgi:TPR repeat protein